jgi:carbon starvation protein CstA
MQALHFCFGLGASISPILEGFMGENAYKIFAVFSLLSMILILTVDSPKIHKQN